ncbi:MAG: hypothetical protein AAFQ82_22255 [Myxococcota bacterium]
MTLIGCGAENWELAESTSPWTAVPLPYLQPLCFVDAFDAVAPHSFDRDYESWARFSRAHTVSLAEPWLEAIRDMLILGDELTPSGETWIDEESGFELRVDSIQREADVIRVSLLFDWLFVRDELALLELDPGGGRLEASLIEIEWTSNSYSGLGLTRSCSESRNLEEVGDVYRLCWDREGRPLDCE